MRGRKPIPTELKRLNGNPGKRPLSDKEPQPEPKLPRAPSFLNKVPNGGVWARSCSTTGC